MAKRAYNNNGSWQMRIHGRLGRQARFSPACRPHEAASPLGSLCPPSGGSMRLRQHFCGEKHFSPQKCCLVAAFS